MDFVPAKDSSLERGKRLFRAASVYWIAGVDA